MAAIGKIRSWGPWLVGIIGLALFGFIATDFTRQCETSSNQARQQVGKVMGEKLSIQEFQTLAEDYKTVFKYLGREIDEDYVREMAWADFVRNTIIEKEAEKLGLGVTDTELKAVLANSSHPILSSLPLVREFYNEAGEFDYNNVTQIYTLLQQQAPDEFQEFDRYWKTVENILRQNLLAQKYETLLKACMLSNESSAKIAFDGENSESSIALVSLAYSSINDNDVTISDNDLKAKYDATKEMFKWNTETRDIKYVVCTVTPSEADLANLRNGLTEAIKELQGDSVNSAEIVAAHRSTIAYRDGMPYNKNGLNRISSQLKAALDTIPDKGVTSIIDYRAMAGDKMADFMAVARLNRRYQDVDSINYQYISVPGTSFEDAQGRADSLIAVIKGGLSIDSVGKNMGLTVQKDWVSADMYQNDETVSSDIRAIYQGIRAAKVGEPCSIGLSNQVRLCVVGERKTATLYDVAIVSNEVRFSTDTEENTYNKFSQFVSECSNADDFEKNAPKYEYNILEQKNLMSNAFYIGENNPLENTREAVKWAFAKASEGSISEIFRNSADGRFMAVAVTKIHPVGYLDQASVQDFLRQEVLKDKKADILMGRLKGVKSVAEAMQKEGAVVDTIGQINFPATVSVHGQQEIGLSGAVSVTQKGQAVAKPVKGTNGVFFFEVLDREFKNDEFDRRKQEAMQMRNNAWLMMSNQRNPYTSYLQVLRDKSNMEDYRYQF